MAIIKSTDLDFDTIKRSLKDYFKQQSEFSDYNFEASGLSNILDVLAYNTHINGLTANLAVNESFLNSAQLRSSVVSHAENLGYYPRSKTGSTATVNITAETSDTTTSTATLPANSSFTTSVDDVSYTFLTTEDHIATNDGSGNFAFKTTESSADLIIKEGSIKTKTFIVGDVDDEQIYVIPDDSLDTTTISVKVFDTTSSSTFSSYTDIKNAVRVDTTSRVFIVRETPNGFYELTFGEGNVLGKAPIAGNKIEVTYFQVQGSASNDASSFSPSSTVTVGSTSVTPTVTTVSNSGGGAEKESITSIKLNAPAAFSSQQRMVTAEDYKAIINKNYSSVLDDVIAWGGNDNVPPDFGSVYVSLRFKDSVTETAKTNTKNAIKTALSANLAVMSIDTEFSDPIDTFVEVTTTFNFDPDLTGDTAETTQTNVQAQIKSFFDNNLNAFGKVFRRSILTGTIDDLSVAILNTSMTLKVQQRLSPTVGTATDYTINFPVKLANPDAEEHIISSSNFTFQSQTCTLKNKLASNTIQIVNSTGAVLNDNVGSYNAASGSISLVQFNPSSIEGTVIKITSTPIDQSTITPLRQHILKFDEDLSVANAVLDFQNTPIVIK
tara:strand:- start:1340 stop:3166 length:1827 start_codon:yes stop_codon:yes gene_type:complete